MKLELGIVWRIDQRITVIIQCLGRIASVKAHITLSEPLVGKDVKRLVVHARGKGRKCSQEQNQ